MTHVIPDDAVRTELSGQYAEAVSKIADSIEEAILAGEITDQDEGLKRVDFAINDVTTFPDLPLAQKLKTTAPPNAAVTQLLLNCIRNNVCS